MGCRRKWGLVEGHLLVWKMYVLYCVYPVTKVEASGGSVGEGCAGRFCHARIFGDFAKQGPTSKARS